MSILSPFPMLRCTRYAFHVSSLSQRARPARSAGSAGLRTSRDFSSSEATARRSSRAPRPHRPGRGAVHGRSGRSSTLNAIFKVLSTHCEPYYTMPWSTSPQTTAAASALALEVDGQRYLVTNAHAVHHASLLELQKPSDDLKCLARVICQGPGAGWHD